MLAWRINANLRLKGSLSASFKNERGFERNVKTGFPDISGEGKRRSECGKIAGRTKYYDVHFKVDNVSSFS